jgi:hypothetical protein
MQTCIESEHKHRDQLIKDWSTFSAADRSKCVTAVKAYAPTYTELITCLEMERDVRQLRAQTPKEDAVAPESTRRTRKTKEKRD